VPYDSEEEQVEALKKWWKENGAAALIGIIVGLTLLFGWRGWQSHLQQQAELASVQYEKMISLLEEKKINEAREVASVLLSDHSNSGYAALTALILAHQDLEDGQIEASQAHLRWVIEQAELPEFTHLARLRLGRLLLSQQKIPEAKALIEGVKTDKFKAGYAELRGDIAVAQGQITTARTAYQEALDDKNVTGEVQKLLQMKLENLGQETLILAPAPDVGHPNTVTEEAITLPVDDSMATPTTTAQ
jgi:predicted negative regulator of RcsB-dependent stress response